MLEPEQNNGEEWRKLEVMLKFNWKCPMGFSCHVSLKLNVWDVWCYGGTKKGSSALFTSYKGLFDPTWKAILEINNINIRLHKKPNKRQFPKASHWEQLSESTTF